MKKSLCLFALAAAVGAASASPLPDYPVVYSAAAGGPVANPAYAPAAAQAAPAPAQTAVPASRTQGRYSLELNAGYGFKAMTGGKYECDMAGMELEGAWYVAPHHALTLSIGYAGGGRTDDYWVVGREGAYPFTDSYDRDSFTLMAGYRYSRMLGKYLIFQAGAKCGMDVQTLDVDYGFGWHAYPYDSFKGQDGTAVGMAYAGYTYLGFFVSPSVCLHAGYQFKGSTAKPSADSGFPDEPKFRTHSLRWHEVRVGLTVHF